MADPLSQHDIFEPPVMSELTSPSLHHDVLHIDPAAAGFHATGPAIPRLPEQINPNAMVRLGTLFRGTETGPTPQEALRVFKGGDLGQGVYLTGSKELAGSYGGGPSASLSKGTRTVHSYDVKPLYPEQVAYIFGGHKYGEPAHLVSGNGIHLWSGEWSAKNIEAVLQRHPDLKAIIGTPDSIGINQISIRSPEILMPKP
jgi:hypothetical protein